MGICASCLGRDHHPSQDESQEVDPLLDDPQPDYGALEGSGLLDEEEVRREREAFEQITAEAADNMLDVSHSNSAEFGTHFGHTNHEREPDEDSKPSADTEEGEEDADEAAWLETLQSEGIDTTTPVRGLESGHLVLDVAHLRPDSGANTVKKSSKAVAR